MLDLSKFSGLCSYCYKDSSDVLAVCFCGITLCLDHLEFHTSKFECGINCVIQQDKNNKIEIKELFDKSQDKAKLTEELNQKIDQFGQSMKCPHFKNVPDLVYQNNTKKCDECYITQNLWICNDCGHVGCGRKQAGCVGNGHALDHFHITKDHTPHHNSILVDSIHSQNQCVFCYSCNDFITHTDTILQSDGSNQGTVANEVTSIKSDILGIKNDGENCYISSVLHLFSTILDDLDLSEHFLLCQSNPLTCICCQFVRIMNEMKKVKNEIKSVRITDFLECVYNNIEGFKSRNQEDCSEFMMLFVEKLSFFEECGLLLKFTDRFIYETETTMSCNKCQFNNCCKSKESMIRCDFDLSLRNAVSNHFKTQKRVCNCGGIIEEKTNLKNLPKYIIVNVFRNRFEDMKCIKVTDPIEIGSVKLILDEKVTSKYRPVGCICHFGNDVSSGHYTWWIDKRGDYLVANDSIIFRSDLNYSQNGSIFLMRR